MSLQSLLESANNQKSMQSTAARLAKKWEATGLLEGVDGAYKDNMSVILENQAKQLVVEQSSTGGGAGSEGTFNAGQGEQWAGVALPLVRKVFGQIAAKEFVSVQPMNLPSGLVFYLDFQYGTDKAPYSKGESLYGNRGGNEPFGNTNEGGFYGAGRFSYSINNTASKGINFTAATASYKDVGFDSDYSASVAAGDLTKVTVAASDLSENFDREAVRAFVISGSGLSADDNIPAFTETDGSDITFILPTNKVPSSTVDVHYSLQPTDQFRGDFEDENPGLNPENGDGINIPEINVQMKSSAIVAKTRKLKAKWTPEFAQDLNAYHSLDAEAELTSILSEHISLEIDLEILDMLMDSAAAGTEYWSAVSNQFINNAGTGFEDRGTAAGGYFNTQGQWFQTLGTKIQKLSNNIHQKTLRGGANFMVVSPKVATVLEAIPGFGTDTNGDADKMNYAFGVQKMGALSGGKLKVYKNPYMVENQILMGYRGTQFLEAGAVFSPYIPLIMTPLVYDPDTFTPRKGLLTRYAKKVVRPEFFGKIKIAGLNTI